MFCDGSLKVHVCNINRNSVFILYKERELVKKEISIRKKEVLLSITSNYKNIIENKMTDAIPVSEENKVWFAITEKFNAMFPNNVFLATDYLKKYYDNLKEDLRERAERKSLIKLEVADQLQKIPLEYIFYF